MKRIMTLLVLAMLSVIAVQAQNAPAQIDIALNDLSNRVGQPLGMTNLSNWNWSQATYPNSALGCEGVQGSGNEITAYQFNLTYAGTTYDYRVSADGTLVVLCGQLDPNQPTPTPPLDEQYSNHLCIESEGELPYPRSRINVGMDVEVTTGVLNFRAAPSPNAEILQQIPTGVPFRVEGGPSCVEDFVWWYVNANGQLGYVAEGQGADYFIQPEQPDPLQSREIISTVNLNQLQELATIAGNFVPQVSWSNDGLRMVMPGAIGSDSIWVYRTDQLILLPEIIESDEAMTTIEMRPNGTQAMFGTDEGTVHLWQVVPDPNLNIIETLFLNTHQRAITSIAFNPISDQFASAGQSALTTVDVDKTWAAIVWDIQTVSQLSILSGHQGLIRDMVWSPDGSTIVTGADDSTVRFWNPITGALLSTVDVGAPVTSLAYSSNGQFIAVGLSQADGRVLMLDATIQTQVAQYQVTSAGISSLAFSPDNTMLLVGGSDNVFAIYDTQSDQPLTAMSVNENVRHVSFSPDGSFITIATDKPEVVFFGVPFVTG